MGWTCDAYGWGEGVYRVLVGKPEGRTQLGRPRRRWVDNIRMDLQEVGCEYMDWIGLAQDKDRWRTVVSAVMNLRVPWNSGNLLTSCKTVSCSRRTLHHALSKYGLCVLRQLPVYKVSRVGGWKFDSASCTVGTLPKPCKPKLSPPLRGGISFGPPCACAKLDRNPIS